MAPSINRNRNHGHGNGNRNSSSVPPSRPLRHRGHRGHHDHRDHGPRRLGLGLQLDLPAKTALSVTEEEGEGGNYDGNVYGDDDDIVLDDNYQDDDDDVQDGEDDDVQDGEDDDDDEAEDSLPAPRTPPKVRTPKFVLPMLPPSAEKGTGAQDSMEDELPDADVATLLLTPPLFAASSSSSSSMEDEPPPPPPTTTMMVTSLAPPSERVAGEEDWNSNSTTDSNGSSEFESIPAPPIALDAVEAETVAEAEEGVEPGGMIGGDTGENGDSVVVAVAEEETNQQPYQEGDWMEGDVHGTLLENKMDDDHDGDEKSEEMEPVVAEEKKEDDVDEEATEDVALLAGAEGETEAETIVYETNATGDKNEEPELEKDSIVDKEQEPEEQEPEQNEELVEEEKEKEAEEKDAEEEQQPPQQPQNEINDTANEGISPPDPETTTNQPTNDETNTLSEGSNDVPEINDQTVQTSWEGFDDIDNHNHNPEQDDPHEYEPDVDSSSSSSSSHSSPEYDDQDASAPSSSFRPDELAYEGDGFHNDNHNATLPSHSTTNNIHNLLPLPLGAILGLATLPLLYYLFHRCRRRRFLDSQKKIDYNRGRYAAIAGGGDYDYDDNADFFSNDFFSEDVSFRGKDSDEDEEDWSVGSEEDVRGGGVNGNGKGMVRIEMGGIHETDANGGLTLEEING